MSEPTAEVDEVPVDESPHRVDEERHAVGATRSRWWLVAGGLVMLALGTVVVAALAWGPDDPAADVAALVPDESLRGEWSFVSTGEFRLEDDAQPVALLVPTDGGELGDAVIVQILPGTTTDEGEPVSVGSRTGTYASRTRDGMSMLAVQHGERVVEVRAAPGTPLAVLEGVAVLVDATAPLASQDFGSEWQLVHSSDGETGTGRSVILVDGSQRFAHIAVREGVGADALAVYGVPYLSEAVQVRSVDGRLVRPAESSLGIVWFERPGVAVIMFVTDDRGISVEDVVELAERLVPVDADGWGEFVDTTEEG